MPQGSEKKLEPTKTVEKEVNQPALPVLDLNKNEEELTDDQLRIIQVLSIDQPMLTDDVAEITGLPVRRVLSALTVLEIDGFACEQGARCFVRTVEIKKE